MALDSLPFLGKDPEFPALIYACGHSRNGILKAPLTGEVVASWFVGEAVDYDLSPFSPVRHDAATTAPPTVD
jgi:glycine oxidase